MSEPAAEVLRAAARLRITTDAKQGLVTPEWVRELAEQTSTRDRYSRDGKTGTGPTEG